MRLLKLLALVYLMAQFIVVGSFLSFFGREWSYWWAHVSAKWAAKLLNLDVTVSGYALPEILVGNHLSYLDILAMLTVEPMCFVTSIETRESGLLGWISQMGGALFVDRRKRTGLQREISNIESALYDGYPVVIFPEATSTNGEQVLPFRSSLFQAAMNQNRIQPFCIQYNRIDRDSVNLSNRDGIFWYGDMTFWSHIWKVLGFKKISVSLKFMDPVYTRRFDDRKEIAQHSWRLVRDRFTAVGI